MTKATKEFTGIILILKRLHKSLTRDWFGKLVYSFLILFVFLGLFNRIIANDKPIYCQYNGKSYFPVFRSLLVDMGVAKWPEDLSDLNWSEKEYDKKLMTLIPYASNNLDLKNIWKGPFDEQNVESLRYRHWFGTDRFGRDLLAGLVNGSGIALWIGLLSALFSLIIGLSLGVLSGFYGNSGVKCSWLQIVMSLVAFALIVFYFNVIFIYSDLSIPLVFKLGIWFLIISVLVGLIKLSIKLSDKYPSAFPKMVIPMDLMVMRFLEVYKSLPTLILILCAIIIVDRPGVFSLAFIIGVLAWEGVAKFSRVQIMHYKEKSFIDTAKSLGLSDMRIILRHLLPNIITPILVVVAFGISAAIISESTLSFLGLGLSLDEVSWGSLLSDARKNFKAWWLVLFPGLAISFTVASFNILGDRLRQSFTD